MVGKVVEFNHLVSADNIATEIANRWTEWNALREKKLVQWAELRNYLYATDTKTTSNALLPWSNTTTTPKLTQIMDNLHANYFATLFPQNKWLRWEGLDQDSTTKLKRDIVQSYTETKIRQSDFINTASDLIYDYITYGNCFAMVEFERNIVDKENGNTVVNYIGPVMRRLSPFDIVFNPAAPSFRSSPKIIRSIMTLGELADMPEFADVFSKALEARGAVKNVGSATIHKSEAFVADGFSSIQHYYESNFIEVLTFFGDFYDQENGKLYKNRMITVVDRAYMAANVEHPSWHGSAPIFHAGWRPRPDNLWAMGPLDNLVGMQYRIDHLENLKADVFDQIAYPVIKIRGDVEDFDFAPGSRIYMGEEGDVGYLVPDATALQADFHIRTLEDKMEEMAGAPRQAMGIRTPGEKTAFEVQTLQNSSSRIFEHKTAHFERTFLEPILNAMLETATRNLDVEETVMMDDDISGGQVPIRITREDLTGNGKLVPVGARHFAERARRVQNLQQLWAVKQSDPSVAVHLSGKEFARIIAEELGEPTLYGENISIKEQAATQAAASDIEADQMEEMQIKAEFGL